MVTDHAGIRPEEPAARGRAAEAEPGWTFLTNHAHVLLCLAQEPDARMRDVAARVGITERAVQRIIVDLEEAGYLERERSGRRNRYQIREDLPLRHPIERHKNISSLLSLVLEEEPGGRNETDAQAPSA